MVYVLNQYGHPLMPTNRHGKVRRLLKEQKAKVIKRCPFTIQLLYNPEHEYLQEVTLGVDAGSKHIGLSATTKEKVLFEADVALRTDIVDNLSTRKELRRSRRNRKTRYRKPRFSNRKRSEGWLAPSVEQKIDCHLGMVEKVTKILPITKIIVEVASFDIQKIKDPNIEDKEYQQGEQLGFWNIREYVLFRDNHTCQCCKGKSKDKVLNVHHIESRKTGGNAPNNLITVCETCHTGYHKGTVELPKTIKRGMSFRDASFMGTMRWAFYDKLKEAYPNVFLTYGYITKNTRIQHGLPKEHFIDARCISGNPLAISSKVVFYYKKNRCHNRQIHKCTTYKGGTRKPNGLPYEVNGFRAMDKVLCRKQEGFIKTRRTRGSFTIIDIFGNMIVDGITYKKLRLLEKRSNYKCQQVIIS